MNRHKQLALVLLLAFMGTAASTEAFQQKPQPPKPSEEKAAPADTKDWVQKIFEIRYADVRQIERLLRVFGTNITSDPDARVIAVSGRPETVTAIEDAVKRLDVPRAVKNIELTAYVLVASQKAGPASEAAAELEPVLRQLKGIFPYQGFQIIDTLMIRVRDGEQGTLMGTFPLTSENASRGYTFTFRSASVSPDAAPLLIQVQDLSLSINPPPGARPAAAQEVGEEQKEPESVRSRNYIRTNLDLREGQKVVVGRSNLDGRSALVLVLTARVLE